MIDWRLALVVLVLLAVAWYLSWTATRLDRLHTRVEGARATLDAALARRSAAATALATSGLLDPASALVLAEAAHEARTGPAQEQELRQAELTQAVRATLDHGLDPGAEPGGRGRDAATGATAARRTGGGTGTGAGTAPAGSGSGPGAPPGEGSLVGTLAADPQGRVLLAELAVACHRAALARRFHNDAVAAARVVRAKRVVRWARLAGRAPLPTTFETDDDLPPALLALAVAAP